MINESIPFPEYDFPENITLVFIHLFGTYDTGKQSSQSQDMQGQKKTCQF